MIVTLNTPKGPVGSMVWYKAAEKLSDVLEKLQQEAEELA